MKFFSILPRKNQKSILENDVLFNLDKFVRKLFFKRFKENRQKLTVYSISPKNLFPSSSIHYSSSFETNKDFMCIINNKIIIIKNNMVYINRVLLGSLPGYFKFLSKDGILCYGMLAYNNTTDLHFYDINNPENLMGSININSVINGFLIFIHKTKIYISMKYYLNDKIKLNLLEYDLQNLDKPVKVLIESTLEYSTKDLSHKIELYVSNVGEPYIIIASYKGYKIARVPHSLAITKITPSEIKEFNILDITKGRYDTGYLILNNYYALTYDFKRVRSMFSHMYIYYFNRINLNKKKWDTILESGSGILLNNDTDSKNPSIIVFDDNQTEKLLVKKINLFNYSTI